MEISGPTLLVIALLSAWAFGSEPGRRIGVVLSLVGVIIGSALTFVTSLECPPSETQACVLEVPDWTAPCVSSGGSALITENGRQVLTAPAGVNASVTCLTLTKVFDSIGGGA